MAKSDKPIWKNKYRNLPNDHVYPKIRSDLLNEGMVGKVQARDNIYGLAYNSKTGVSFDCTTLCPKHVRGLACAYCYREHSLDTGFNAKLACSETKYEGEIMKLKDSTIKTIAEDKGGLRLFSFGDYIDTEQCKRNLKAVISDANARGLPVKAVTKRPDFVRDYNDKIAQVNVSVDSIGSGVRWKEAKALRRKYRNVQIRAVVLNPSEIDEWGKRDWVDILTPYHGPSVDYKVNTEDPHYRKEIAEREKECEIVDGTKECEIVKKSITFQDVQPAKHKEIKKKLEDDYAARTCCMQGNCGLCLVHCGKGRTSCKTKVMMEEDDHMLKNDIARVLKGGSSIEYFKKQASAAHSPHMPHLIGRGVIKLARLDKCGNLIKQ